jgi:hypothetical protein
MNACLYDFPPVNEPSKRGRKKTKGERLYNFKKMVEMPDLGWTEVSIEGYGQKKKRLKYITAVSLWGADGFLPIPIRWVLTVDPEGELDPVPLMSTDLVMSVEKIIALYFRRWSIEVTFEEVREHLGVETQRQWSDKAIARTTPILLGLYTIVCLICNRVAKEQPIEVAQTAWYEKKNATFSDLLKTVRTILWRDNLIFRKPVFESFLENNKDLNEPIATEERILKESWWIKTLIEQLAAA